MKKMGYVGSVIPIRVRVTPDSDLVKAKVVSAGAELVQPTGMIDLKTSFDQDTGVISTLVAPEQYVREGQYQVFIKARFDDGSDASFPVELEVKPRLIGEPLPSHIRSVEQVSDMVKAVDKPVDQQYIPYSHLKAIQAYDPTIGFSTRLSALYDLKFYHSEDLPDEKLRDDWRLAVAWWCTLVPDEDSLVYPVDKVIDLAAKIAKEFKKRGLPISREFGSSDQQELYQILSDRGIDLPNISAPGEEEDKNIPVKGAEEISKGEKVDDSEHRSSPAESPGVNCVVADEITKGNEGNAAMHKHIIPGHPGFEGKEHPISQLHDDVPTVGVKTALPTRSRPSLGQIHHPAPRKYMQEHVDPAKHLDEVIKAFDARIAGYEPDMRVSMFDGRKHLTTSMDDLACWNCPRVQDVGSLLWCPLMGIVDPLQVCRFYDLPVYVIGIGDADDLKKSKVVEAEAEVVKAPEELICAVGPQAKLEPATVQRGGRVFASHRWKGKRGQTHTPSGKPIPKHWTHVLITTRKNSPLQAVGKDAAGRTQYLYSSTREAKKASEKWNRLRSFGKVVGVLDQAIERKAKRSDEGLILDIIKHTGFRIGSDTDTKAKVKAYGISTLLAKHVKIDGDRVEFSFIGKSGVKNHKVIRDAQIAEGLGKRLARAKSPDDKIFSTNDDCVRNVFHQLPRVNTFLVKDWRLYLGTQTALAAIKRLPMPKNAIQFIKARRIVAKKVAQALGNTPAVALKYYIAPEVFSPWLAKLAAVGVDIKKEEGGYCVDSGDADTNRVGGYQFGSGALMKAEDEDDIGIPESLEELFECVSYDTEGAGWEGDLETEYDPDDEDAG